MASSKLKIVGTILELEFAAECIRRGAIVSQPFGDNAHYDFLIDNHQRIYRVQVKAASLKADRKSYSVNLTRKLPKMRPRLRVAHLDRCRMRKVLWIVLSPGPAKVGTSLMSLMG